MSHPGMHTRFTYRHLLAACVLLSWTIGLVWLAIYLAAPSPEEVRRADHTKLLHLLDQFIEVERATQKEVSELIATTPGIDYNKVYQGLDLSSVEGIQIARQRGTAFVKQMDAFTQIQEEAWVKVRTIVSKSDLDEPLQGQLKAKLALDEADVYPKYRAWHSASTEDGEAVTQYLNTSEHYLGQFKWADKGLNFTDPKVASDITKAQAALKLAEDHYTQAAASALKSRSHTLMFVRDTIRDLQERIKADINAEKDQDSDDHH